MDVTSWCESSSDVALAAAGINSFVMLYGKVPIVIYFYVVLCAVLVPLIIGVLFPLRDPICEFFVVLLLHNWKSMALKRTALIDSFASS